MKKEDVWLTEEQKDKLRGVDLNTWKPVIVPSDAKENLDKKDWPLFWIKNMMTLPNKAIRLYKKAVSGDPDALFEYSRYIIGNTRNHRSLETGKKLKFKKTGGLVDENIIDETPIKWLLEFAYASNYGGATEEEILGVKS